MPMTAGTNQPVTRSATRWIGAFEPCARSTSVTIWDRVVSRPIRSARMTNEPLALIVAPIAWSPTALSTGIDSPVSIDSSTDELPSIRTPSTGTRSPGRTRTRSPTTTSSTGTSRSPPGRSTRAVSGRSCMSAFNAPAARPLARASSQRPRRISPMMTAAESK